jgi:hypothetical protein
LADISILSRARSEDSVVVQDLVVDQEVARHLVDSEEVGLVADQEVGDHLVDLVEVDLVVEETTLPPNPPMPDPLPPDPPVDDDTPLPLFPKANAFGSKLPTKY